MVKREDLFYSRTLSAETLLQASLAVLRVRIFPPSQVMIGLVSGRLVQVCATQRPGRGSSARLQRMVKSYPPHSNSKEGIEP